MTLDLTTHVPPALASKKAASQTKTPRGSNKSLANARSSAQQSAQNSIADTTSQPDLPEASCMQILDLHGHSPLISYNNALYSCQWATDLGTSFFLVPPPTTLDPDHLPLRSTPSFDLLGTTSARLIAIPASLQPRKAPLVPFINLQNYKDGETYTTTSGDVIQHSPSHGLHIELPATASAVKVNQARFLERLSAIKARRGDRDAIPVSNVKTYKYPDDWEAERDEWILKETSKSEKHRQEAELRTGNGPRRRRTKSAAATSQVVDDANGESPAPEVDEQADSEEDYYSPDPDHIDLGGLVRKRRPRGFRGGAPSGKRLRQSLGLPDARRNHKPVGRPRKIHIDAGIATGGSVTEQSASPAPQQSIGESVGGQAMGGAIQGEGDTAMEDAV